MAQQNKKLTIGILPENMAPIRKFQNLVELETETVFSLGNSVYLASLICSRIMNGENPTTKDILNGAKELCNAQ